MTEAAIEMRADTASKESKVPTWIWGVVTVMMAVVIL